MKSDVESSIEFDDDDIKYAIHNSGLRLVALFLNAESLQIVEGDIVYVNISFDELEQLLEESKPIRLNHLLKGK
jgi:hypothetical protein